MINTLFIEQGQNYGLSIRRNVSNFANLQFYRKVTPFLLILLLLLAGGYYTVIASLSERAKAKSINVSLCFQNGSKATH